MNEDPTTPEDAEISEDDLDAVTGGVSIAGNSPQGNLGNSGNPGVNYVPGSPGGNH